MLSESLSVDNTQWTSYKKLWMKLKITRKKAKSASNKEEQIKLKQEEIEISKKIRKIARFLTDKNGVHIPIPVFPYLGSIQ